MSVHVYNRFFTCINIDKQITNIPNVYVHHQQSGRCIFCILKMTFAYFAYRAYFFAYFAYCMQYRAMSSKPAYCLHIVHIYLHIYLHILHTDLICIFCILNILIYIFCIWFNILFDILCILNPITYFAYCAY